jgi:hypothetical protein
MIEGGGHLVWPEYNLRGGIRQNLSAAQRRYRILRNANWTNLQGLKKDLGIRRLTVETLESGNYDTIAGFDAHFNDGTQHVMIFQDDGSATDIYIFTNVGRTWGSPLGTSLARVTPDIMMFNNKVCMFDGTNFTTMTSNKTLAQPATTGYNACTMGTVYANRLLAAGDSSAPYSFKPSEVRNETSAKSANIVDVTGVQGESIKAIGRVGPYAVVGGRTFTRVYYLGTGGPKDWDWDEISGMTGPIDQKSFVEVSLARGNETQDFAFFWGPEGPMMIAYKGQGLPALYPLWEPLWHSVKGREYEEVPYMNLSRMTDIQGVYYPEYREVRFSWSKTTGTINNAFWCLDFDSAVAYAENPRENYPYWRIRDNSGMNFPGSSAFLVRINPITGLPSTTGVNKVFTSCNGIVYEMDAQGVYKDDGQPIPMFAKLDGFDGVEDGIRDQVKSINHVYTHTNHAGVFELYINIIADEGNEQQIDTADLSGNLSQWTDAIEEGSWGDGDLWSSGGALPARTEHGVLGRRHAVEVYDLGNINNELYLQSLTLEGELEDRR